MIRLKIKNDYYKIIDSFSVNESSREVKFSSLKIDFTNKTIADLPLKYQEVNLVELNDDYSIKEIIYTGYVNNFVLPKMKNRIEYRELELDLISPLSMATIRTTDAVGTYTLKPLIREIIQPLIDDGFVLKELNVGDNQATVNYLNETCESALNKLSNRFNFWWYIDKNKNIFINSIEYLISKEPVITYDDDNKLNGLISIVPSINAVDYCNVVDFTNVRLYSESYYDRYYTTIPGEQEPTLTIDYYNPVIQRDYIKSGEEIMFDNPFDISPDNYLELKTQSNRFSIFSIWKLVNNVNVQVLSVNVASNGTLQLVGDVSIDDTFNEEHEWVLLRDSFFKNLIVGLKYNGTTFEVGSINSNTALVWSKLRIINNEEVNRNKGIISETGIVEKQVDLNEQWKTYNEIVTMANSYMKINTSKVEQVKLELDKDTHLKIGDTIKISKSSFLVDDTYIVTDKTIEFTNNVTNWIFTLKNTNVLESYIDLFRADEQESSDKDFHLITSNYIEEGFKETHEVIINES